MKFFVKVHVSDWLADMRSMTEAEIDTDSTLEALEEKLQEFISKSNSLGRDQVMVTALLSEGRDEIDHFGGDALKAALVKESITFDLQDFPWGDGSDIIKLM